MFHENNKPKNAHTSIIDYHPSPNSLLKVFFFYSGLSERTGALGGSGDFTGLLPVGLVVIWVGALFVPKKLAKSFFVGPLAMPAAGLSFSMGLLVTIGEMTGICPVVGFLASVFVFPPPKKLPKSTNLGCSGLETGGLVLGVFPLIGLLG